MHITRLGAIVCVFSVFFTGPVLRVFSQYAKDGSCGFGFGATIVCSGSWSVTVPGRSGGSGGGGGAAGQGEGGQGSGPVGGSSSSPSPVGSPSPSPSPSSGPGSGPRSRGSGLAILRQGGLPILRVGAVYVAPAGGGGVGVSAVTLALRFWRTIDLPTPHASVPPGWAITGKPAYLVTSGTGDPAPYRDATPLGELTLAAVGTYRVNWGDGIATGPYHSAGLPWPSGRITHTYTTVGTYRIVVSESWSATWRLGGAGGTLTGLVTTVTIPDFPVKQVQAVIVH